MNLSHKKPIKIAIPSNGRMFDDVKNIFDSMNIDITPQGRQLSKEIHLNGDMILLYYLRSKDIPTVIKKGYADIGFSTDGPILENNIKNLTIVPLKTGEHRFVLAMLNGKDLTNDSVIATSYPKITQQYLKSKGFDKVRILSFSGAIEAFPVMGIADGVVEITQSGASLTANNLVEKEQIYMAQTVLLTNQSALKHQHIKNFFNQLKGDK